MDRIISPSKPQNFVYEYASNPENLSNWAAGDFKKDVEAVKADLLNLKKQVKAQP